MMQYGSSGGRHSQLTYLGNVLNVKIKIQLKKKRINIKFLKVPYQ